MDGGWIDGHINGSASLNIICAIDITRQDKIISFTSPTMGEILCRVQRNLHELHV